MHRFQPRQHRLTTTSKPQPEAKFRLQRLQCRKCKGRCITSYNTPQACGRPQLGPPVSGWVGTSSPRSIVCGPTIHKIATMPGFDGTANVLVSFALAAAVDLLEVSKAFDPPSYLQLLNLYFIIICISFIVVAVEVLSAYPWLSRYPELDLTCHNKMGFCGLVRRKGVQKPNEKTGNNQGGEKLKQPSQANHPKFAAHQRQRQNLGPRPVINTRNSNFSQASTLDVPATPPPLYQSHPQSPHHDGFLPLIKQQSPFRAIPEITVSTGLNSHRPGSSTTSNTDQNSLVAIADTPPPTIRTKLASRPENFDVTSRPSSLRPSTASVVESIMTSNSSPRVSLDPLAPAIRPHFNSSQNSLGRLSPAPPIPRVSSKRLRPGSLPHSAQTIPAIRRQSPNNITRKPICQAPSIPPLPKFGGFGSLRVPQSQSSGVHRSDTVASRYDHEGIREEEDSDWMPPVPGLDIHAYMDLVGGTPYEVDDVYSPMSAKPEVLVARSHSYRRGCASSRTKGVEVEAPAVRIGEFARVGSISKERHFEEEDRVPTDARDRYLERLTDVPAIKLVSVLQRPGAAERQASAEKRWSLRVEQGGSPTALPVPASIVEKRLSAPAPLRVMRSSGLIVDVPVLKKEPRPPTKQERQERRNASGKR